MAMPGTPEPGQEKVLIMKYSINQEYRKVK
jgi:hypothetical protein